MRGTSGVNGTRQELENSRVCEYRLNGLFRKKVAEFTRCIHRKAVIG